MSRTLVSSRRYAPVILVLLVLACAAPAMAAPARDHEITIDDYFTQSALTGLALSPDGSRVAYTEMRWEEAEDGRNTDLWVADTRTGETLRLTFDTASDSGPQWSPDGKWIYFRTSRKQGDADKPPYNGKAQVWRIPREGGEPFAVTRLEKGIDAFQLSPDGQTLYYTVSEESVDDDDWKSLRKEFKKLQYGHGVHDFTQLWKLDLRSWRSEKLADPGRVIFEFQVSPDEQRVALLSRPDETLLSNEGWSRVDVLTLADASMLSLPDRQWREEAPSPYGWMHGLTWTDDSQVLGFRVDFDGYPGEVFFAHFDQGPAPVIQKMVRPGEVTVEGAMAFRPGTRTFCFVADDFARGRVYGVKGIRGGAQGEAVTLTPGDVVVDGFGFSADGRQLAVLMSGPQLPEDIFMVRNPGPGAKFDRVTKVNPQIDTWKLPRMQIVRWTSDDGTPVEGILELPPDYQPGEGPLPLLVAIHGGPTSSSHFGFRYWIYGRTLYAAQGWAVLDPNYRGSTGYGDKFLIDLVGNKNQLDVQDILSGVNQLIADGIADPEKMAVTGWSNGGYLTNCVITHDQRFKAASSGAGVFDTVMQWSIEDTPGHVINFNKGLPWESAEAMHESSPLYDVDKVKTPTLIHVGENDPRVPPEHSRSLYRALKQYLDVPAELIVYPGEGHGLTKMSHRRAKLSWDQQWFDHYVKGEGQEPAPPEMPGSE